MTAIHWSAALSTLDACDEDITWAQTQPDLETAWQTCERPDWLVWLLARLSGDHGSTTHRAIVLTVCACARTALPVLPPDELRPRCAIETTERWARGETSVTLNDVCADGARSADAATAVHGTVDAATYAAYGVGAATPAYVDAAWVLDADPAYVDAGWAARASAVVACAVMAHSATYATRVTARARLCHLIRERHPTPPCLSEPEACKRGS